MIQSISLKAGLPVNLTGLTSSLSNDITSRAAFGNKCKDKEVLISLLQEATSLSGGFAMEDQGSHLGHLPHRTLGDLTKQYGPLMHLQLGEVSTMVVSSPKVAEQFMKTHDLIFADRPQILATEVLSSGFGVSFSPYGSYWRQMRKLLMLELLSSKRVQSFRYIREEEVTNLIQRFSLVLGSSTNFSERIFSCITDITSRAAFGKKCKDKESFVSCMHEIVKLAGGFDICDMFPSVKFLRLVSSTKHKLEKSDQEISNIIMDHRENRTRETKMAHELEEDLVDALIRAQENNEFKPAIETKNIKSIIMLGEVSAIVVSSPKVAELFMKTHDLNFSNRPQIIAAQIMSYGCTDVAFSPYGTYWRQLRKIFMVELLGAKRVQAFKSIREEEVSNFIQRISCNTGAPVNLTEKISSLTIDMVSRAAFGLKCNDKEAFISHMLEVTKLAGGFDIADIFPSLKLLHVLVGTKEKLELLHQKVDKTLNDVIKDHKANRATTINSSMSCEMEEDFVDVLLQLQESGTLESPMTTDNLKAVIWVSICLSWLELVTQFLVRM
ncbi:hypothetical protein MKW92_043293 [Papaver armeniacum]|nr:hypothetical protein MKW92_043293 [Papaver armeniacum]